MENLTQDQVRAEIAYDPETGAFTRRGKPAGGPNAKGYWTVSVLGKQRIASRLAWLYQTGTLPARNIVFVDGDRSNLRWSNMRLAEDLDVLTAERVREVFNYDPRTGALTYRRCRGGRRGEGEEAGFLCRRSNRQGGGYILVGFNGREYGAHRLIWLWWHGREANGYIDHIDMDRSNNRIENLRECTQSQNLANTRRLSTNTSGFKGVSRVSGSAKWRATIGRRHLGVFDTPEEAHAAYVAAAKKKFGEFARFA